jgi:hypothetical protein
VQTFKVGTAEKKKTLLSITIFVVSVPSRYYFFFKFFSRASRSPRPAATAHRTRRRRSSPNPPRPHPHPITRYAQRTARTHARTHTNISVKTRRLNTTPEWRCDGMFEFRYAAFQCENFSLSHSAAFAAAAAAAATAVEKRDRRSRRFCRRTL